MIKIYTCKNKGGYYKVVGTSKGAGPLRDQVLIVYQDLKDEQMYHRTEDDFNDRMEEIDLDHVYKFWLWKNIP